MNVIFLNWESYGNYDIQLTLKQLGHHVTTVEMAQEIDTKGIEAEEFIHNLEHLIKETHCELVFSLNYFPVASTACQHQHCTYISWIYDNPYIRVYDKSITNECNHVFTFDSHMVTNLKARGIDNVHYAPLAANVARLTSIPITPEQQKLYSCDISFVGSIYKERHNHYDELMTLAKDDPFLTGYLEGLINAQKQVFGYNFLAECLTPDIMDRIHNYREFPPLDNYYITEEEIFSDYFLSRQLAFIERVELIQTLSEFFDVHFYTYTDIQIGKAKVHSTINYNTEMPCLFRTSKINLNSSLRSIQHGIPLRAMDILGSGGFLLTNFQEDLLRHFDEDKHFVSYSSLEEACEKCAYYLTHETQRQQIINNAREIMKNEHTLEIRLQQLIDYAFS